MFQGCFKGVSRVFQECVTQGNIRLREDNRSTKTFKYRATAAYNSLPVDVRTGTQTTVKKKMKMWVAQNIPIDWG